MSMVNPRSALENSWTSAACDQVGGIGCWLGLTDRSNGTNSTWFWGDGTPLSYSNWAVRDGKPEGNGGSNEHHAAIFPSADISGTRYLRSWYDTVFGRGQFFAACQTTRGGDTSLCSSSDARFVSAAVAADAAVTAARGCAGELKCDILNSGGADIKRSLMMFICAAALLPLLL